MIFVGKRDKDLGVKKRTIEKRLFFGPNAIRVVVVVVLAAFSLFYLSQSGQSATRNYIISDLNQQKQDMSSEQNRLEVEANRLKALSLIQEDADQKGMVPVSQ